MGDAARSPVCRRVSRAEGSASGNVPRMKGMGLERRVPGRLQHVERRGNESEEVGRVRSRRLRGAGKSLQFTELVF